MIFRLAVLASALLTLLLQGCATSSPTQAEPTTQFRVMTYNIHHGEGLDGKVNLERIAHLIRREGADIVALQEVDQGVARTARRDFPAELAQLTGMTCVFSNNHTFQGGNYGNAVLSRFPVKRWTNFHYRMLRPNEQRGLLQLVLDVHGREVVIMNTHIDHRPDDAERWSNIEEIESVVREHTGKPIILAGDFNDVPGSRVHQRLSHTFDDTWERIGNGDGLTIPAEAPRKRIDYLWISKGGTITPLKVRVVPSDASDHLPVLAEFQLNSKRPTTH
jgi:endonuclease/exonuclease/phosphatase family metal-dependent hydrolase